jgi:hypothetical protein
MLFAVARTVHGLGMDGPQLGAEPKVFARRNGWSARAQKRAKTIEFANSIWISLKKETLSEGDILGFVLGSN